MGQQREPWIAWGRSSGATTLVTVVGLSLAAGLDSLSVLGAGGTRVAIALYGDSAMGELAALVIAYAVWQLEPGLTRSTWLLIGAGVFADAIGDGLWASGAASLNSAASLGVNLGDVFYLATYVLFAFAVVRWVAAQRERVDLAWIATESLVAAAVVGATVWVALLSPALRAQRAMTAAVAIDVGWVVADFPLLVAPTLLLALALLRLGDERLASAWFTFSVAMVLVVLADVGWFWERSHGGWAPGSLVDFAFMASNVLIAVSALTALDIQTDSKPRKRVASQLPA